MPIDISPELSAAQQDASGCVAANGDGGGIGTVPVPTGKRGSFLLIALVLIMALLTAAPSANTAPDALGFINDLGHRIIEVLDPKVSAGQRLSRFRELFREDFDVAGIGHFVLGRYWPTASPQKQQEFLRAFEDFITQAYSSRLGSAFRGERFRTTGTHQNGGAILVSSEIIHEHDSPTAIDWFLIDRGGHLKISDVNVEGISIKMTEHDEFTAFLQRNGGQLDGLLKQLREKAAAAN